MGLIVTLAEVKTFLQIGFTDDDALLSQLAWLVSGQIESYCLRSFSDIEKVSDRLDGGHRQLILTRCPIAEILAIVDQTGRASQELLGTGNASATAFPFSLKNAPLQAGNPGSVQIVTVPGGIVALDDGAGNLIGTGIAGSSVVNYTTGAGLVNYSAPPASGAAVKAAYNPIAAIVDPSIYEIDSLAGLVLPLPLAPTNFPIGAGMFEFLGRGNAIWGRGKLRWQIIYHAGESRAPAPIKKGALKEIAGDYNRRDDLETETIGDYSYQSEKGESGLSVKLEQLLSRYKEIVI